MNKNIIPKAIIWGLSGIVVVLGILIFISPPGLFPDPANGLRAVSQVMIDNITRENALRLSVGDEHLYPDGSFTLVVPGPTDPMPFLFYVELDNSTEVLTSPTQRDSWLKKLRFYEALQNSTPMRFRVLGLITRSQQRLQNISTLAASVVANPQRSLFYGAYLPDYLQHATPLTAPLFTDHRGLHVSLIPQMFIPAETRTPSTVVERTHVVSGSRER